MNDIVSRLIMATILYLINMSIGVIVAMHENLPARFAGILNGQDVPKDLLTFNSTAVSPSLLYMVVIAVLVVAEFKGEIIDYSF
jgi:hypothetical protein